MVLPKKVDLYVLVDGIRDFYSGGEYLGCNPAAVRTIPYVAKQLERARTNGALIISLEDWHAKTDEEYLGTLEGEYLPLPHGIRDTPGAELECRFLDIFKEAKILDDFDESTEAMVVEILDICAFRLDEIAKSGLRLKKGSFGSLCFTLFLKALRDEGYGIGEVHFYGTLTGMCVISNVINAKTAAPNARIFVHRDGCADLDEDEQAIALHSVARLHVEIV